MAGEVDDPQCVAGDAQSHCLVELLLGADFAFVEGRDLDSRHAAAETQLALAVEVLDGFRHPVVAAGHVMQRQVDPDGHAALVGTRAGHGAQVTGLAAEVARCRRVLIVAVGGAALRRRVVHGFERAALQVCRQIRIIGYECP